MKKINKRPGASDTWNRTKPGAEYIKIRNTDKTSSFYIKKRENLLSSSSCMNCHDTSLENLENNNSYSKNAHWDITVKHGGTQNLNCNNCHNTNRLDKLHTVTGRNIDYNSSFKLCASCHSNQYNDWLGGAHGKAVEGWKTPRIMQTCVDCHNPHLPTIENRWPSPAKSYSVKHPQN
jgi:nitrate/TMAO reductase-like tetraheme cytochrome c subunit